VRGDGRGPFAVVAADAGDDRASCRGGVATVLGDGAGEVGGSGRCLGSVGVGAGGGRGAYGGALLGVETGPCCDDC
jgi:hypothetical protein